MTAPIPAGGATRADRASERARADRLADAVRALAKELEGESEERTYIAARLPDRPRYHMEINRLVVGAAHQRRAAARLRALLDDGGAR